MYLSVSLGYRMKDKMRLLQNSKSLVISPVPSARESPWVHKIVNVHNLRNPEV